MFVKAQILLAIIFFCNNNKIKLYWVQAACIVSSRPVSCNPFYLSLQYVDVREVSYEGTAYALLTDWNTNWSNYFILIFGETIMHWIVLLYFIILIQSAGKFYDEKLSLIIIE